MPFLDGTGPRGQGPMTGRGMGYCAGIVTPGFPPMTGRGWYGWGMGRGMGFGRGWGPGMGFGFGRGWGRGMGFGFGRGWGRGMGFGFGRGWGSRYMPYY